MVRPIITGDPGLSSDGDSHKSSCLEEIGLLY